MHSSYDISDPICTVDDIVSDYTYDTYVFDDPDNDQFYVKIVWFCYILGGWKALACTDLPDQRYFEITYDKHKKQIYLDVYDKFENKVIHNA